MFNIGPAEMAVLAIIAVVVFGPDRLPSLAKQAAQMLRTVREMSSNARKQLSELSPGLDESLRDLDLGQLGGGAKFNARTALQKMIFEDDEPTPSKPVPAPLATDSLPSTQEPAVTMEKAERAGPTVPMEKPASAVSATDDIT
ncbi:MAG: sec-independent translocation protein [Pseudonocardiales bacterium]|nr:sec-independent translocation protein [Pseudonocardiales bacterium]